MGRAPQAPADLTPDPEIFADAPWRRLRKRALGRAAAVPTMLSRAEQLLYLWLAEHWATGDGAVVDIGCFAGGSTACLAEGIRRAGRTTTVTAYDRFRVSEDLKTSLLCPAGVPPFEGDDLLPVAEELLSGWGATIELRRGEVEDAVWTGGPIEILAVDAAKSAGTADRIAEIFFPHLVPGRSVVIQQDHLHWKLPWLPAQMEWMAGCFRPVAHCPGDTVVFLCTARPDEATLAAGRVRNRRDAELRQAIAEAAARISDWGFGDRFATQIEANARNPNVRRAKDMANRP